MLSPILEVISLICLVSIITIIIVLLMRDFVKSMKIKPIKVTCSYDERDDMNFIYYIDLLGLPFKVENDVMVIEHQGLSMFLFKNNKDMKYIEKLLNKHEIIMFISFESSKTYLLHYDFTEHKWIYDLVSNTLDVSKIYRDHKISHKKGPIDISKIKRFENKFRVETKNIDTTK